MAAIAIPRAVEARSLFAHCDPAPTLAQFESYVGAGQIHYFIAGGIRAGGNSTASAIESWVSQHFTATTAGGVTIYDLTKPVS